MCIGNEVKLIEFNGLPGSGKSSISFQLIKELKLKNKLVLSENDVFNEERFFVKVYELLMGLFSSRSVVLNYSLIRLGVKVSIKNKSFHNLKNSIKIIRYNFMLAKTIRERQFDLICLSEGFVQFIYCIYDGIDFYECGELVTILDELNRLYENLLIVNCTISKSETLKRIGSRTSKRNTVDLMSEKEQIKFIELRDINMEHINKYVTKAMNVLKINSLKDIDDNVSKILYQTKLDYCYGEHN